MESSLRVNVWNPSASKRATFITSAITSSASPINDRLFRRAAGAFVALLFGVLITAPGAANQPDPRPRTAELREAFSRLEARDDAKHAKGAIEQARRALEAASKAGAGTAKIARAQGIARAAITLAERQLARRKTQAELFATQRRLNAVRARANAQRRALEALMRDRASLARKMEEP